MREPPAKCILGITQLTGIVITITRGLWLRKIGQYTFDSEIYQAKVVLKIPLMI